MRERCFIYYNFILLQKTFSIKISEQIKSGDKSAFELFFKMHYGSLCSYANNFVNDKDSAEEIVQEIFYQIWQKYEDINITSSFESYVYRSVHNVCLNFIKHKNIQQKHPEFTIKQNQNTNNEFSDVLEVNELQKKIRESIDNLPPERKKIFLMIRYENLKYL